MAKCGSESVKKVKDFSAYQIYLQKIKYSVTQHIRKEGRTDLFQRGVPRLKTCTIPYHTMYLKRKINNLSTENRCLIRVINTLLSYGRRQS